MNYEQVYNSIAGVSQSEAQHAHAYIAYLRKLEAEKKKDNNGQWIIANPWFARFSDQKAIDLYKTVQSKGLFIDGDTVLLQVRSGDVVPDYTYNAYKNLVQKKYPETTFDWGIVYAGDSFEFRKECGRVIYTHTMGDPFARNRVIVGAYGIIKNGSGEFIETINQDDIEKFKNVAKTKTIWNTWFDRMVLKSIIKRICHSSFKDLVDTIDKDDNENYDLDLVNIACDIQAELAACRTKAQVKAFYDKYLPKTKNVNELVTICAKRKNEIIAADNETHS